MAVGGKEAVLVVAFKPAHLGWLLPVRQLGVGSLEPQSLGAGGTLRVVSLRTGSRRLPGLLLVVIGWQVDRALASCDWLAGW